MLTLFKNHNMMMPVDFGDNPYTIETEELTQTTHPSLEASPSKWDWNKLFFPMQEAMNPKPVDSSLDKADDDFKYASPFAKKSTVPFKPAVLNPNAPPFNFLNPNAVPFDMSSTETDVWSSQRTKYASPFSSVPTPSSPSSTTNKTPNDETILAMHGFKKIRKMKDSLQGAIYYGETIKGHDIVQQLKIPKAKKRRVVIKKTLKSMHNKRISRQDDMNIIVDENIVKEAIILHHLTVDNNPAGSAICKLISFFESAKAYYIVVEYCGSDSLKDFVDKAHAYIKEGKLAVSHWKKICKYVAWQIAATLYWMHHDMNCAHLDLTLDNIIVNNGNFIVNESDGSITIDRNLSCKIIDFGLSEIFADETMKNKPYFKYDPDEGLLGLFHVNSKYSIASNHQCPEIFNEEVYDARKADMWSLGVVMFYMHFGLYPYEQQLTTDSGYWSCKHNKIGLFLDMKHLSHLYNTKLIALLSGCLCVEEEERFNIGKVITNVWFKTYFKRYADKMQEQSRQQLEKNGNNKRKMDQNIPYYKPSENTAW
eukprot:204015_1